MTRNWSNRPQAMPHLISRPPGCMFSLAFPPHPGAHLHNSSLRGLATLLLSLFGIAFSQDDANWSRKFGSPGLLGPSFSSGFAYAVAVAPNGDVYAGGGLAYAGTAKSNNIARFNKAADAWEAMGTGLSGQRVHAIAINGSDVYAGGEFNLAGNGDGNVPVSNIAKWDTVTKKWSALGVGVGGLPVAGIPTSVNALVVSDGMLYVGGRFSTAGGLTVANVAVWDIAAGEWKAMGAGLDGNVLSLVAKGGTVYAAGSLYVLNGANRAEGMAVWDGAAWGPMGTGFSMSPSIGTATVGALAIGGDSLYAVGRFQTAPGVVAKWVAVYNLTSKVWSALGGDGNGPSLPEMNAVAVSGSELFLAGNFVSDAYGNTVNHIMKFDLAAKTGSSLKLGMTQGPSPITVFGLAAGDGNLYVAGQFTLQGGSRGENVARWNLAGKTWSALGADGGITAHVQMGPSELPGHVRALAGDSDGNVYAGGTFIGAGTVRATHVAVWNGKAWDSLGTGITGTNTLSSVSIVAAIAAMGRDVYVGGTFFAAGGVTTPNLARWDRTAKTWSPLGGGVGAGTSSVTSLVALDGQLYVAGNFTGVTDTELRPATGVARWNPTANTWKGLLGHNLTGPRVLLAVGKNIYVGGNGVKKWNVADTVWEAVLAPGDVRAMAEGDSILYMGGFFGSPNNAKSIMKLDLRTNVLSRLGDSSTNGLRALNGTQGTVNAISKVSGGIIVSGQFATAGGKPAANVAYWQEASQTWFPLGSGTDDIALASYPVGDTTYVAGNFNLAGGTLSTRIAAFVGLPTVGVGVKPLARMKAEGQSPLRMQGGAFRLSLPMGRVVSLKVFDFQGKTVAEMPERWMGAGEHAVPMAQRASGLLFYRLTLDGAVTAGTFGSESINP
ncbi:MAG: hypothetical protein JWO30_4365 [Fibrobacteres bacterium]|nr:hypothetical protein [Fibrobacterota bacterium]